MADLIVDFPRSRRIADLIVDFPRSKRCSSDSSESGCLKRCMSVQFSERVKVQLYERHDNISSSELWYSKVDYKIMISLKKQAILEARQQICSVSASDSIETDCLDNLTGLENHLTTNIVKKTLLSRLKCMYAVMNEQERQRLSEEHCPYSLQCVAQYHTKWTAQRARTIGHLDLGTVQDMNFWRI